ncbi:DUF5959 family protein [Actinomycetota bacterium Odt1-20B]
MAGFVPMDLVHLADDEGNSVRVDLVLYERKLDAWAAALDALDAGEDIAWMEMSRGASLCIRLAGERDCPEADFAQWAARHTAEELTEPFTFVVGLDGALRLAPRRRGAPAGGGGQQSADRILPGHRVTAGRGSGARSSRPRAPGLLHARGRIPPLSRLP